MGEYVLKSKTQEFKIQWESDEKKPNKAIMTLTNDRAQDVTFPVDGYLLGTIIAVLERIVHKWDGFIVTTGDVGDGKTTIGFVIGAIWESLWQRVLNIDNIVFRSAILLRMIDMADNETVYFQYDESIEGASGGDASTRLGKVMKKAFVQKRFKRHLYNFVIDDITNLAPQYVKRIRAWIHVESEGIKRGKYRVYTNQRKIRSMYRAAKQHPTKEVTFVTPEWYGSFPDYTGMFIEEGAYTQKKFDETQSEDMEDEKKSKWYTRYAALLKALKEDKVSNYKLGEMMGVSEGSVRRDLLDIEKQNKLEAKQNA